MESVTTKPACGEADARLFDNSFDPIEEGLRAKVRVFIEALIEEERTAALGCPHYIRRRPDEDAPANAVGFADSADRNLPQMEGPFRPSGATTLCRLT